MVAATGTVGVEVRRNDAALLRYFAAGESNAMLPAGEMWSVVMKSPRKASARASLMGSAGAGCAPMPSKYGARRTYVEASSHANVSDGSLPLLPGGVAVVQAARTLLEQLLRGETLQQVGDLGIGRPDVSQFTGVPSARSPRTALGRSTSMVPASE